jgi:site-specific DNA-methyltransferase (adenine-specific)
MNFVLNKLPYFTNDPLPARFSPPCISIETYRPCGGELKTYGEYKDRMIPAGVDLSVLFAEDA